jgi:signal transduction histidine kinase
VTDQLPSRRILLVEDDPAVTDAMGDLLDGEGYDVAVARDGRDALAQLRQGFGAELIILDLRMPGMTGWEFRVEQRSDPALAHIPVVAVSADATPQAAAVDAAAYLSKPFDVQELLRVIERVLLTEDRKRMRAQLALAERMASIGTLAAGVAHEINNPLTAVLANLPLIAEDLEELAAAVATAGRRGGGAPREEEMSTRIVGMRSGVEDCISAAERIRRIVSDMGALAGSPSEAPSVVDPLRALEAAVRMVKAHAERRATVVSDLRPVALVLAPPGHLEQLFLNLLLNAAQSIEEGKPDENWVRASTAMDGDGMVRIQIADTGCGIAPEIRGRIFEPFFTTRAVGKGMASGARIRTAPTGARPGGARDRLSVDVAADSQATWSH